VRGPLESAHIVQLFDTPESLARTVAGFLNEGYHAGESLLVVATAEHWSLLAQELDRLGCRTEPALREGQLVVLDAAETLRQLMKGRAPDFARFLHVVGSLVRRLGARDRRVRIYGEMVDLLAAAGDYDAAQQLEELWNDLAVHQSFTLFCGYSSVHFGDQRTAEALRAICRSHTHVQPSPGDDLGTYLVAQPDVGHRTPAARFSRFRPA
jgi:hypothetical protein